MNINKSKNNCYHFHACMRLNDKIKLDRELLFDMKGIFKIMNQQCDTVKSIISSGNFDKVHSDICA